VAPFGFAVIRFELHVDVLWAHTAFIRRGFFCKMSCSLRPWRSIRCHRPDYSNRGSKRRFWGQFNCFMFGVTGIVSLQGVALGCRALYRPRHRHRHAHVPARVPYSYWQPPHHATWHHLHYRAHDYSWYGILTFPNMLNVVR
jgi:hypothetical protein